MSFRNAADSTASAIATVACILSLPLTQWRLFGSPFSGVTRRPWRSPIVILTAILVMFAVHTAFRYGGYPDWDGPGTERGGRLRMIGSIAGLAVLLGAIATGVPDYAWWGVAASIVIQLGAWIAAGRITRP